MNTLMDSMSLENNSFSQKKSTPSNVSSNCSVTNNVHFLESSHPAPKEIKLNISLPSENSETYISDIETMTRTELKNKYNLTYNAWKNMKTRCKKGYVLSPEFFDFRNFLRIMGPRPNKSFTIDRIVNEDLNYSTNNCRWADKYTQNQNKKNNIYLSFNGETKTISAWAKQTNQKADTLYHRKKMGWSDNDIIQGKHASTDSKIEIWPEKSKDQWEKAYLANTLKSETRWQFLFRKCTEEYQKIRKWCESNIDPFEDTVPLELQKKILMIEHHRARARDGIAREREMTKKKIDLWD